MKNNKCPNCGNENPSNYNICIYCGYEYDESKSNNGEYIKCSNCGKDVPKNYEYCCYCGSHLEDNILDNKDIYFTNRKHVHYPLSVLIFIIIFFTIFISGGVFAVSTLISNAEGMSYIMVVPIALGFIVLPLTILISFIVAFIKGKKK